jgi:hypothetical protein
MIWGVWYRDVTASGTQAAPLEQFECASAIPDWKTGRGFAVVALLGMTWGRKYPVCLKRCGAAVAREEPAVGRFYMGELGRGVMGLAMETLACGVARRTLSGDPKGD